MNPIEIAKKKLTEKLINKDKVLNTEDLYGLIKGELGELTLMEFRMEMGKAFKYGLLPEFMSLRGRNGGIRLYDGREREPFETPPIEGESIPKPKKPVKESLENESSLEDIESDESDSPGAIIMLSKTTRVYNVDKRNWAYQKLSGVDKYGKEIWLSQAYWPDLEHAMIGLAKKLLNNQLRLNINITTLSGLKKEINSGVEEVIKQLKELPVEK